MNTNENIRNAFNVVRKTYENTDKLMRSLDELSGKYNYESKLDRFTRYSSDLDTYGWLFNSFGKIYQFKEDKILNSYWRDGYIYYVEINFKEEPKLIVAIANYELTGWENGISPSHYWEISNAVNHRDEFITDKLKEDYYKSKPISESVSKKYWKFKDAIFKEYDLTEITNENIEEKVFIEFNKMRNFSS